MKQVDKFEPESLSQVRMNWIAEVREKSHLILNYPINYNYNSKNLDKIGYQLAGRRFVFVEVVQVDFVDIHRNGWKAHLVLQL